MKFGSLFLKGCFFVGGFFLLMMLLWSSNLREKDFKRLIGEIEALQKKVDDLPSRLERNAHFAVQKVAEAEVTRKWDDRYPNLLEEDPFYKKTLPQMLGKDFVPQGARREATLGKPENLHPFNGFHNTSQLLGMCSGSVAKLKFGKYETLAPDLAIKMEQRPIEGKEGEFEYWIHLRDHLYWQPLKQKSFGNDLVLADHFSKKHPVTAHDFKFYYDAIMNPSVTEAKAAAMRTYYGEIEELRVIDDLTFVVRWKSVALANEKGEKVPKIKYSARSLTGSLTPLPRFVFQYFADGQKIVEDDSAIDTYMTNSIWAQNFSEHWAKNIIVSCGPWIFEQCNDEGVTFTRNPDYYEPYAVLVEKFTYTFKESTDAIWQDFKAGKVDMCTLTPNQLIELEDFLKSPEYEMQKKSGLAIQEVDYIDLAYIYIGWNESKPFFASEKVRQAMTMAIDRNRIIRQNLNNMAISISGPFFRHSPSYNAQVEPWPYNPDGAKRLLDEEGWVDANGDGVRDKLIGDKLEPFKFTLSYYVKSVAARSVAEFVKSSLRTIGVECQLQGLDLPDLSKHFDDKNFDAIYLGWKLGTPPEDPRQLWHSSGAKLKGSSNAIGFSNSEIDALIEKLNYEEDSKTRLALYHTFHTIIHKCAPYTFMYSPKTRLLYREYVQNLFIPLERQDLVPGADISEPDTNLIWLKK